MNRKRLIAIATVVFLLLLTVRARASGFSTVGNGDDGSDLEGAMPLTSGPLVDARGKAAALLTRLDTAGIRGLGMLLPEVNTSPLYFVDVEKIANLPGDQGSFHGDMAGRVYARTLATPHAATRFFPVAKSLSESQLVALHIHEGLHRALSPAIREDESIVTQLTLAITGPAATHDQVRQVAAQLIPMTDEDLRNMPPASGSSYGTTPVSRSSEVVRYKQPSNIGYAARYFFRGDSTSLYPITFMQVIHSDVYPFGGPNTPFGLGIEGSLIHTDHGMQVGPLGLSARLRVWSQRDFDVGIFGSAALNTLSNEELKNSPFGRDVYTLGTSLRKTMAHFYVENYLSLNFGGKSTQRLGRVAYNYEYGHVLNVKIRGGARFGRFDLGLFTEMHLADHFRVSGGAFAMDIGRFHILSAGPELTWSNDDFALSVFSRFILASTKDANLDYLGNLMGPGISRGSIGASMSVFF